MLAEGGKGPLLQGIKLFTLQILFSLVMTIWLVPFFDLFMHVLAETILPAYS